MKWKGLWTVMPVEDSAGEATFLVTIGPKPEDHFYLWSGVLAEHIVRLHNEARAKNSKFDF